jgi:heme/copper-type cytochrome/quinol oxidase subunit 2
MKTLLLTVLATAAGAGVTSVLARRWSVPDVTHPLPATPPLPTSAEPVAHRAPAAGADAIYTAVELDTASDGVRVELIGEGNRWRVAYRDAIGVRVKMPPPAGATTPTLRVPAGATVHLGLTSRDFVYVLQLPRLGRSQVAVPGREFAAAFRTQSPGTFVLPGGHLCGPPAASLDLTVRVEPRSDFDAWFAYLNRGAEPQE